MEGKCGGISLASALALMGLRSAKAVAVGIASIGSGSYWELGSNLGMLPPGANGRMYLRRNALPARRWLGLQVAAKSG